VPSLERPEVAHLRRDPGLLRDACHEAGLVDVVRERLLAAYAYRFIAMIEMYA
jgi:hypothetical protein